MGWVERLACVEDRCYSFADLTVRRLKGTGMERVSTELHRDVSYPVRWGKRLGWLGLTEGKRRAEAGASSPCCIQVSERHVTSLGGHPMPPLGRQQARKQGACGREMGVPRSERPGGHKTTS